MEKSIIILYLDPEPHNLHAFSAWFRRKEAYACHTCSTEEEALTFLQRYPVQVLLCDQPDTAGTGMEFLVRVPYGLQPPVKIVVSTYRESAILERAVKEGLITGYFSKPIDFEALEELLGKVVSDQWAVIRKKEEE